MQHVVATFVPSLMTDEQTQKRLDVNQELCDRAKNDENSSENITCDEKWIQEYVDKKVNFLNCERVVQREFLTLGQTVNKEYYLQVMKSFREAVRRIRTIRGRGIMDPTP